MGRRSLIVAWVAVLLAGTQSYAGTLLGLELVRPTVLGGNLTIDYNASTNLLTISGFASELVYPDESKVNILSDTDNVYSLSVSVDTAGNLIDSTGQLLIKGKLDGASTVTTFASSLNVIAFGYELTGGGPEWDFIFGGSTGTLGPSVAVQAFDLNYIEGLSEYDYSQGFTVDGAKSDNYAVPLPLAALAGGACLGLLAVARRHRAFRVE